jgi:hypothetical protein
MLACELYKNHSKRVAKILLSHPELMASGAKLVEKHLSGIKSILDGGRMKITYLELWEVRRLLSDLAKFGDEGLNTYIQSVLASLLNVFVDEIRAIGRRKKLKVLSYAPTTVRKFICNDGWADKKALSEAIALVYPELKVYLTQDRMWKEKYHQNMFDAVALGLMASSSRTTGSRVGKI